MLVLSRKIGEVIRIGDDISIRIVSISGTRVRFGIEAPREVEVHREEVYNESRGSKYNQPREERDANSQSNEADDDEDDDTPRLADDFKW